MAGKNGGDSRNGKRSKTALTDVGPVETAVPRDPDGSARRAARWPLGGTSGPSGLLRRSYGATAASG